MVRGILFAAVVAATPSQAQLPADDSSATARINSSPRHGEWVRYDAGNGDSVRAWVVYPERRERAPVVIVVQEIFGLSDWIRGVADQLAADGFIAIAPDMLSGKGPGGADVTDRQQATQLTRALGYAEVMRRLEAAARFATALPAASGRVGVVGFCWGGSNSFNLATHFAGLGAAVVYYGASPPDSNLAAVHAPVLGLYAGDDARVNATVPQAQATMQRLGKRFEVEMYDGAGHGFLRQQTGRDGANLRAARLAWPRTIAFFREHLR